MEGFFRFFIGMLLIGIAAFMFIYTGHQFECALPNGGYFKIKWDEIHRKVDLLYWQPQTKSRKIPNDVIVIEGPPPEVKKKGRSF